MKLWLQHARVNSSEAQLGTDTWSVRKIAVTAKSSKSYRQVRRSSAKASLTSFSLEALQTQHSSRTATGVAIPCHGAAQLHGGARGKLGDWLGRGWDTPSPSLFCSNKVREEWLPGIHGFQSVLFPMYSVLRYAELFVSFFFSPFVPWQLRFRCSPLRPFWLPLRARSSSRAQLAAQREHVGRCRCVSVLRILVWALV